MSSTKKCLVYETLNSLSDLKVIEEGKSNGNVRLSGTFGVCGVRNNNKRVYEKENYGKMVSLLQEQLSTGKGVLGELEHPNSMNITLENVSHKIEKIQMNEDGTITGDIVLLNTPKGRIALAIVEGGVPLYISSRGAGSIDESGNVTLSQLVTYDLVGTPGFSQAEFNLSNNQAFESLNENLCVIYECDGNSCDDDKNANNKNNNNEEMAKNNTPSFALIDANKDGKISLAEWTKAGFDEETFKKIDTNGDGVISKEEFDKHYGVTLESIKDMLLDIRKSINEAGDDDSKDEPKGDDDDDSKDEPKDDEGDDDAKKSKKSKDDKDDDDDSKDDNSDKDDDKKEGKVTMDKLADMIKELADDVKKISASQHTDEANESAKLDRIQDWIVNEYGRELKEQLANGIQNWINEEYTPSIASNVEGWITECFAPTIEGWVCEQFAPTVEGWVNEQLAPTINDWVNEQFAPTVQEWLVEQYTPTVETWLNEHYSNEVYDNVNAFLESKKDENLDHINSILEMVEKVESPAQVAKAINEGVQDKYSNEYIVTNMPSQYKPSWNMCTESKKDEIMNRAKIYDFTKDGVLEQFWATTDFTDKQVDENTNEKKSMYSVYESNVFATMKRLQGAY